VWISAGDCTAERLFAFEPTVMESLGKHRRSLSYSEPYSAPEPSLTRSFSHSRWNYGNPTVVSVILDIQPVISTIARSCFSVIALLASFSCTPALQSPPAS
jgi:hypothetical protein